MLETFGLMECSLAVNPIETGNIPSLKHYDSRMNLWVVMVSEIDFCRSNTQAPELICFIMCRQKSRSGSTLSKDPFC